jgi:hypothetical protein
VEGEACHTASYRYRLADSDAKDAWLLRWEYDRRPPRSDYPYPRAHVHANGALRGLKALHTNPASRLHIPTARVPLELVLWHLIAEWGVKPKRSDWRNFLERSILDFEQKRTVP